jgi:hypothetical protein
MSINDLVDELEGRAHAALADAGAFTRCAAHPGSTYRLGDPDLDKKAYAIATNALKRDGLMEMRQEVMDAIKDAIDEIPDECPDCMRAISRD